MKKVALVGGGCSAVLVALQLLRQKRVSCEITIFDSSEALGLGVAYGTTDSLHCLNVPAVKMGAFADGHDDFYKWITEKEYDYAPTDFVPRPLFGKYLLDRLDSAIEDARGVSSCIHVRDAVVDISKSETPSKSEYRLLLSSGEAREFDDVVIAIGLPEGGWPKNIEGLEATIKEHPDHFFEDVWSQDIGRIQEGESVGVVGTGLTAVDITLSILTERVNTKVIMFSRHGMLPHPHFTEASMPVPKDKSHFEGNLRSAFRTFRKLLEEYRWDAVIDAIRPNIPSLWSKFSTQERGRFIRHLRHRWDIHRHRMAPHIRRQLDQWITEKRLTILSGRLEQVSFVSGEIRFSIRENSSNQLLTYQVNSFCNCTGFQSFSDADYFGLLANLVKKGMVKLDYSKNGVEPTPLLSFQLAPGLYLLGALLRAVRWESIAVPELRMQAQEVAAEILVAS